MEPRAKTRRWLGMATPIDPPVITGDLPGRNRRCRIGVDTYAYHRLLGDVREGELPPRDRLPSWFAAVEEAAAAGADVVAIQTHSTTLADAERRLADRAAAPENARQQGPHGGLGTIWNPSRICFSWGHPAGLEFGRSAAAEADARRWLAVAARLGHDRMRIVVGHRDLVRDPAGDGDLQAAIPAVARLVALAESAGVVLAVENHADLRAAQLARLVDDIGSPRLGVCFDTANAVRVGDDVLAAAAMLAPWTVMAHVKDVGSQGWRDRSGPVSVPLASGSLPVRQVVDMLRPTAGIDLWLLVELGHLGERDIDERTIIRVELGRLREWIVACE